MQKIAINRRFDDIKDKKIDSTNDNLEKKEAEPIRVVRQYINPAIYVESCVYDMAPFKRSPVFLNYYSDDDSARRVVKVKRCVCLTNPYNCPCHPSIPNTEHSDTSPRVNLQSNRKKSNSASVSQVSLKSDETATTLKQNASELKLSIPSLATTCVSFNLDYQQEAFKSWCARKDKERKRIEEERLKQNQLKEEERQRQLEEERENFRRWLLNKKKEEERRRREREFEIEQDKVKEETKEKRRVENELKYKLWLKQKEELYLGRFFFESAGKQIGV